MPFPWKVIRNENGELELIEIEKWVVEEVD